MSRKRQENIDDGKHRVVIKLRESEETKELIKEFCFSYLNVSMSVYLSELIRKDEEFKKWLYKRGKKVLD